jgi:hypothetical protein
VHASHPIRRAIRRARAHGSRRERSAGRWARASHEPRLRSATTAAAIQPSPIPYRRDCRTP